MSSHSKTEAAEAGPSAAPGRDRRPAPLWVRGWILQAVLLGLAVLLYRWFGHRVIEDGHAGRSLAFVNEIFAGRTHIPVTRFLSTADWAVDNLLFFGLAFLGLQLVALVYFRGRHTRTRIDRKPEPLVTPSLELEGESDAPMSPEGTSVVNDMEDGDHAKAESAQATPALSTGKKALFSSIVLLIPLLFVLIPYLVRFQQYRSGLEAPAGLEEGTYVPPAMPELTPEQLLQVGKGHQARKPPLQSYLNYPEEKPDGAIRVGIFGGSFSLGEEAALEHDTATHLERLLAEAGAPNVEVINFGVSGFGVSQAALLWEYVGKKYDLDYVVMMPFYFHATRDNSFLHTSRHFGPIHGIYVAEGDTARFVPVVGKDRLDSCRKYFSPFQSLRYWRYDDRVPMAFRPLLPNPYERRGNPFYYKSNARAAAYEMYCRLYEKIATETDQLIVFTDQRIHPELAEIHGGNIFVFPSMLESFREPGSSLYRAPFDHPSGIGYEIYASELAALLLGKERPEFKTLWLADELSPVDSLDVEIGDLSSVNLTDLVIGNSIVADLRQRKAGDSRRGRYRRRVHFDEEGVSGLAMYAKGDFRVFIPLSFVPENGDEIRLEWNQDGEPRARTLGHVSGMRGPVGQAGINWERLKLQNQDDVFLQMVDGDELGILNIETRAEVSNVRVTIGGETALLGETRELRKRRLPGVLGRLFLGAPWIRSVCVFTPEISSFMYFRGCLGHYVDVPGLPSDHGVLELTLWNREGSFDVLPLFSYQVVPVHGPPFDPPYTAPVATSAASPSQSEN